MSIPAGNILFAKLNLPVLDKKIAAEQVDSLNGKGSVWDPYRGMYLTPFTITEPNKQEYQWVDHTPKIIVEWFEDVIFPYIGMKSRVMLLNTPPNTANYEHIDCDKQELNTLQHKFRIVVRGTTDSLYFMTDKGNVSPPNIEEGFIMDGGWPHGMINNSEESKLTLALGYPWLGQEYYDDKVQLLMNRNHYKMPETIDHLWEK